MDVALPSIRSSVCGQLVLTLITLEPHGVGSNAAYLYIFTLSSHRYAKQGQGFVEHSYGRSRSVSENAHNSLIIWHILIKFSYLYIVTLSGNWYAKRGLGFAEHPAGPQWSVSENAHYS